MTPREGRTYIPAQVLPPPESARAAGLRYVADSRPGIARVRNGAGFRYRGADGRAIRDAAALARIRSLAIPPAWREVWICPSAEGHLQATGRDAKGRKQYRYHARWREIRDETKYGRMAAFARALPRIRSRVRRDLARPGLPRDKALATVVRLLETTFIRVGNDEYARENASFGLTTLRAHQVRVRGARLRFRFRGKSGVEHRIELADRQLAAIVRRMQDLPGEELLCYVGDDGVARTIESDDVNRYLKECAGEEFTSKDFRTWAGTLLAARALRGREASSVGEARRELAQAVAQVARRLGNTPAVCRKCYIHPAIIEAYLEGSLEEPLQRGASERAALISLLERRHGPAGRVRRPRRSSNPHARGTRLAAASHAVSS